MLEIDYTLFNDFIKELCDKLEVKSPLKCDSEISIKKAIDIAYENLKDSIKDGSILSKDDIKEHIFITIYLDLKNLIDSENEASINYFLKNHYLQGIFADPNIIESFKSDDINDEFQGAYNKVNSFMGEYRKNMGNSNIFAICKSKSSHNFKVDRRIYPSEISVINFLINKYLYHAGSLSEKIKDNSKYSIKLPSEINPKEASFASGKFKKSASYKDWISFVNEIIKESKSEEYSKDLHFLYHIEKNWDIILINEIFEELSKREQPTGLKIRWMLDLFLICLCPDIINRRKFIKSYFIPFDGEFAYVDDDKKRIEWLKELIKVSVVDIPILYYYTLNIILRTTTDDKKEAILRIKEVVNYNEKEYFRSIESSKTNLINRIPMSISENEDLKLDKYYKDIYNNIKRSRNVLWQFKINKFNNKKVIENYSTDVEKYIDRISLITSNYYNETEKYVVRKLRKALDKDFINKSAYLDDKELVMTVIRELKLMIRSAKYPNKYTKIESRKKL